MENNNKIKEITISKFGMFSKFAKAIFFSLFRMKWVLPDVSEITTDQLKERINSGETPIMVDLRDRVDFYGAEGSRRKYGYIPSAKSIPIMQLTAYIKDLSPSKDNEIVTICPGGGMSLAAADILLDAGFTDVKSLKGGMEDWAKKGYPTTTELDPNFPLRVGETVSTDGVGERFGSDETYVDEVHHTVDARNESCPIPILKSKNAIVQLKIGQVLEILTTDPGSKKDIPAWAHVTGQNLISTEYKNPEEFRFIILKMK